MRNKLSSSKGITLIELLVAIAIVGFIFAAAMTGLKSVLNVELRRSASQLASTLRYLSNKAVTDHLHLRIIFDLEANSYHVEETANAFVISAKDEEEKAKEEAEKEKKAPSPKEDNDEPPPADSVFSASESKILKPTPLPSGVLFKDIFVSYLEGKREGGVVSVYFFPDGYATPAVINLKNEEDDEHYSIELKALSGQVSVRSEYAEGFSWESSK